MKSLISYIRGGLPIIYCDLDETLVDFYAGVNKALNKFGYPDWQDPHWKEFTNEQAQELRWAIVNKQPNLWLSMNFLKDGRKLWEFIKPHNPHILSHAIDLSPTAYSEKYEWVKKNLGINNDGNIHIVLRRSEKASYAQNDGKPNLLIDDHIKNCEEFKQAGGLAIHHTSALNTISELKKLGF